MTRRWLGVRYWQTEGFDDVESARVFNAVGEAGQNWPPGWVKGTGHIEPEAVAEQ
ncbi:hypothetical protein ACFO9E_29000 [Streptomyces maoxianensis]|uniref:Uncharacterized protein n=1 Tax=Streptomyces maoxianensis TaxID=1459942 RepID=A0ABV9GGP5_9ACTN